MRAEGGEGVFVDDEANDDDEKEGDNEEDIDDFEGF